MSRGVLSLSVLSAALAVPVVVSCSSPATDEGDEGTVGGGNGTGGAPNGGAPGGVSGTATTGGALTGGATTGGASTGGASTGGASTGGVATGGASGTAPGGAAGTPGSGGTDVAGSGGAPAGGTAGMGMGGAPGGMGGAAGAGIAGSFVGGGMGGSAPYTLDCGGKASVVEGHGPPANRANYLIVGDGYSATDLMPGGALDQHIMAAMTKRFSDPVGQPFLRYRNFVNICVLRLPSSPICGSSLFSCCGDDGSRLANCNTQAANTAIQQNMPASFEVDWRAIMLNGSSWWNSGGAVMLFSGGNRDAGGAALHEGGHGFHSLSDEYGNCEQSRVSREATYGVNVSLMANSSGDKWPGWVGYNQTPGTGMQGFFACDGSQTWRPSSNSMMNSLFGTNPNTSYNPVSREKIIMDIWRLVQTPYDSVTPPAGAVTNPTTLTVNVIDPAVISVDWTLDGQVVARNMGPTYNIGAANLSAGMHTVTARAYDNAGMDLVRQVPGTTFNRQYWGSGAMGHSDKTVTWTVTKQ